MGKLVYIVGTRHRFQGCRQNLYHTPKQQLDEFATLLKEAVKTYDVRSLAEEMNQESLIKYARSDMPPKTSVLLIVAKELGLPHKYCDPDTARRVELGITINAELNEEDQRKREAAWLSELNHFGPFPCLFVLGSEHTHSFRDLLTAYGFKAIILEEEWWPPR